MSEQSSGTPADEFDCCAGDCTAEEYYIKRDEYMRYIALEVNPARLAAGLLEIREHEARECYRIIIDFQRKWSEPLSNRAITNKETSDER